LRIQTNNKRSRKSWDEEEEKKEKEKKMKERKKRPESKNNTIEKSYNLLGVQIFSRVQIHQRGLGIQLQANLGRSARGQTIAER
jgi:hypothetical protein